MDPVKRLAILLLTYYGNENELSVAHIQEEAARIFGANRNATDAALALMDEEGCLIRSAENSGLVHFAMPEDLKGLTY